MQLQKSLKLSLTAWIIIAAVIILDQAMKIWIKTSFYLGEDLEILPWFHLRFIQNNGMAFGIELGSKLFLTLFRIVLVCLLIWYILRLIRKASVPCGYMACLALITAGAFGNIIDCVCYGEIFTNPYPPMTAELVPWGDGYGGIFQGLVVDMLYFPLFSFTWPAWLPVIGGKVFSFFDPVFNIADVAISVGMISIVLFYFNMMEHSLEDEKPRKDTAD